ncbi:MAG: GAF domain-containing protein [Chloroflexi bacterium]|nr:GAF domain-containing protein [Chloroflexota bacterium]
MPPDVSPSTQDRPSYRKGFWVGPTMQESSPNEFTRRQQTWLLSIILTIVLSLAVVANIWPFLFLEFRQPLAQPTVQVSLGIMVALTMAYILNHTGHFHLASIVTLLSISIGLLIIVAKDYAPDDVHEGLIYFVIPIFICSLLYPVRITALFSLLCLAMILSIGELIANPTYQEIYFAGQFVLVVALFILLISYLRQKLLSDWKNTVFHNQVILTEQNAYLQALHETSLALMSRQKLDDLLQVILERAAQLADTKHGNIYLVSADATWIEPRVTLGVYEKSTGGALQRGEGFVGKIWETGEPLVLDDYDTWSGRLPTFDKNLAHASIGVPLVSEGRVLGALSLSYVEAHRRFTPDQVALLGRFGQLASIALDTTQLYSALQKELAERQHSGARLKQQNDYLSALHETAIALTSRLKLKDLLQDILERAARLVEANHGSIQVLGPNDGRMRVGAAIGALKHIYPDEEARLGIGLAGKVWATGQVICLSDYDKWEERHENVPSGFLHAVVGVPLKVGSVVSGVLNLGYQDPARQFTAGEIELLTRFAELAAIALDNAYLYAALQQELTDRVRAEISLRNSEAYYRALIENTSDIITLVDREGIIQYESPSVQRILGYTTDDRLHHSIFDYVYPTDTAELLGGFLQSTSTSTIVYRGRQKDGAWRILEATTTNLLDNPAVQAIITTSRDITDRRKALEELRASEERFRQLTENIREVFWMTSADFSQVLYVSPAFETTWGRSRDEVYGAATAHLADVLPEYQSQMRRMFVRSKRGAATDIEVPIKRPSDGEIRWIWSRTFPVYDGDGNFYRVAGVLEDITERKQVEVRLVNLLESERDQRIFAEALRDSANAISSSATQSEALNHILEYLGRVVPHDGANILLFDPVTGFGHVAGNHGYAGGLGFAEFPRVIGLNILGMPLLREMVETRLPKVLSDVRQEPRWVVHENEQWIRSWIGAPIMRADTVIGFINLDSASPGFYNEQHRERLVVFAGQLGVTLENARLLELERDQRIFAEALRDTTAAINSTLTFDEVLAQVLANVDRMVRYDAANIMLLNEDKTQATVAKFRGYDDPARQEFIKSLVLEIAKTPNLQHMILTRQPLAIRSVKEFLDWVPIPEAEWIESTVAAPILREQEVIGFIHLDSSKVGFFNDTDARRLQAFADQIGLALENARLYELERDQRIFAEALRAAAAAVGSTLDLNEVLSQIFQHIARVVPHDSANIMLINPDGMSVNIIGAFGYAPETLNYLQNTHINFLEVTHMRRILETGLPLIVPNVDELESWLVSPNLKWIQSYISAPIRREGKVIGFLNLDSSIAGFFKKEHTGRLVAFADQVGIAIYNAQLYESERRQRLLAETLRDIGIVLTGSLHQQEILPKILEQIARVVPYDAAGVWLKRDGLWRLSVGVGYDRFGVELEVYALAFTTGNSDIIRLLMQNPQVIIVSRLPYEGQDLKIKAFDWIHSWVVAPIISMGEVIGYFSLDHTQPDFYGPEYKPVLETLASQISIVMENARLLEGVEHEAAVLEEHVIERTMELQRERSQLQAILDAMGEGVIYSEYQRASEKSQVQFVNNAFSQLTGFSLPELAARPIGKLIEELFGTEGVEKLLLGVYSRFNEGYAEQNGAGRKIQRVQLTLQRRDGSQLEVAVTSTTSGTQDTPLHWQLMLVRDISQEKALEAQKSRFVANASHELRTPLANLKTRLYLLRKQPDKLDTHVDVIERTTERMISLVEDLLNVSRFERGIIPFEPTKTDLLRLVKEVLDDQQMEANRKSIYIGRQLPDAPFYLDLDPKRIHQVITNVVVNAISYTPEYGAITVSVIPQEASVLIQVQDTGPGIAPEVLEHVFDPFFRASEGKVSGTGLGLTIAKEIVERHSGLIWAESESGHGSVFKILLPLQEQE